MRQTTKAAAECTVTVQFVDALKTTLLNFPQPKLIGNYRDNIIYPYILIPEVIPLMKQNMSSVIVFPEQGGLLKTLLGC